MPFRLATFNVENLVRRFDFSGFHNRLAMDRALALFAIEDEKQFEALEQARIVALSDDTRQLTALALARTGADIVCLQEVDDAAALSAFEGNYLFRMVGRGYPHKLVSNGNDPRGIDVAVMTRDATPGGEAIEVVRTASHAGLTFADLGPLPPGLAGRQPAERVFRRDCFAVDLKVGGKPLALFVVHLKSMNGGRSGAAGRDASMPLRTAEARAVRAVVERHFGGPAAAARQDWAICGDFNDYRERIVVTGGDLDFYRFEPAAEAASALDVLLGDGFAVDVVARRPVLDRWTLYHTRGPQERHLCQLDYILLSPALAERNQGAVPDIVRGGQPFRTPFLPEQEVPRFPRVGWDRPKASDHCPVAVTLSLG